MFNATTLNTFFIFMIPYDFISVLIMPTDYCNMNCVYCFNNRKTHHKEKTMSLKTVEKIFSSTIPYYKDIKFIWHGGEPLSMGIDFYKDVIKLQKEINTRETKITNTLQTNLTLLDEEFSSFLIENEFHIGSSFDGTTNEITRHNSSKILSGRKLIIDAGGRVGFICVVQSNNIDHLIDDYNWFKENKINYTINQYMPTNSYESDPLFVSAEHYAKRICEFYDHWEKDSKCNISISYFENYIEYMLFGCKKLCCYNSCLGKYVGIHYNGEIYNCNRDFPNEYSYGNIYDYTDIHECFDSPGFNKMLNGAIKRRNWCKKNCEIFDFCAGGCSSCAQMSGDITTVNAHVCETTKAIYHHINGRIQELLTKGTQNNVNPYLTEKLKKYNKKGVINHV